MESVAESLALGPRNLSDKLLIITDQCQDWFAIYLVPCLYSVNTTVFRIRACVVKHKAAQIMALLHSQHAPTASLLCQSTFKWYDNIPSASVLHAKQIIQPPEQVANPVLYICIHGTDFSRHYRG